MVHKIDMGSRDSRLQQQLFLRHHCCDSRLSLEVEVDLGRCFGKPNGFSTQSADYDPGNIEYFDVYSPLVKMRYSPLVKMRYSQVYWTMMPSVPLACNCDIIVFDQILKGDL